MWQRDRRRCLDACVKQGAACNTDHQLLRIKIKVTGKGEAISGPRSARGLMFHGLQAEMEQVDNSTESLIAGQQKYGSVRALWKRSGQLHSQA